MKLKLLAKLFILGVLIIPAIIPGLFATWNYSFLPTEEKIVQLSSFVKEFFYTPEELLPGDDGATNIHENHLILINNVVDHIDYGLNTDKKPILLNLLLSQKDLVYSNQTVKGGNLKHMLLDSSDVDNLMFVVEYVSDTEFATYTFSGTLATYSNMDSYIAVYKTQILYESGKWESVRSFEGKAKVFRPQIVDISVNIETWEKI